MGEPSTLVARARALRPQLEARAEQCERERLVPHETIAAFDAAGFFDMLKPKRFGGLECHPNEFYDVLIECAAGCPSSAWVLGVVAAHAWQLALFPLAAQEEVWGQDRATRISSSYMPVGKLTPVDGGYRLSGKWGFSSGCDHCTWVMLGGMAPPSKPGGAPDMLTLLLPRSDYGFVDDWFVSGLKGTGSKTVVVDDVFVPEHRTHRMSDAFKLESPGNAVNPAPLYRLPFGQVFTRTVATPAIGMLQGAIDAYLEANRDRTSRADGKKPADDPAAQEAVAAALLAIREVRALLRADFDEMMALAEAGKPIPIPDRVGYRQHAAAVTERMTRALDELFAESGSGAIFLGGKMQRFFQDVHAARTHFANNPRRASRNLGNTSLGRATTDFFL